MNKFRSNITLSDMREKRRITACKCFKTAVSFYVTSRAADCDGYEHEGQSSGSQLYAYCKQQHVLFEGSCSTEVKERENLSEYRPCLLVVFSWFLSDVYLKSCQSNLLTCKSLLQRQSKQSSHSVHVFIKTAKQNYCSKCQKYCESM